MSNNDTLGTSRTEDDMTYEMLNNRELTEFYAELGQATGAYEMMGKRKNKAEIERLSNERAQVIDEMGRRGLFREEALNKRMGKEKTGLF